jgi:hypothetical protein
MANVLAVGMLIGQRRPGSRPFLMGFETFGTMASALFITLASGFPREVVLPCVALFVSALKWFIGPDRPFVEIPILFVAVLVLLGWPPVALALVGGLLSRWFKITRR